RDIESVARENAVEGCVRETHAALLACSQARAATDPAIRSAMTAIADDETRHAALAWAVDDWSQSLLASAARRRVREARHEAIDQLINAQLTHVPLAGLPADARALAGLPDQEAATRMAVELGAALV
ncbi:MAG TPA: ferritin-like domain-containing protein, partial [Polyangia bacterium]|nr:ferritin-like domain-containing protein [Polyangia bacterium]